MKTRNEFLPYKHNGQWYVNERPVTIRVLPEDEKQKYLDKMRENPYNTSNPINTESMM